MFVLAGLGGAWVSLEVTGAVFQTIGHLSPVAWAMDGFKNVICAVSWIRCCSRAADRLYGLFTSLANMLDQ
jgi:hypothetical protein